MQIKQSFLLLIRKIRIVNLIVPPPLPPTPVLSQNFTTAISARNLGVTFDYNKNIDSIFHKLVVTTFTTLVTFPEFTAKIIATALVNSRLDHCNSLYYNTALKDILKLLCVQNCLARVVTWFPHFSHSVSLLKSLHWLLRL